MKMDPSQSSILSQVLVGGTAGIIGLAFAIQKLLAGWKESSTENSVMTLMHTELERMSKHNTKLSVELNKLQIEVVTLNQELRKLTAENQQLHSEVAALTAEVTRLQTIIAQDREVRSGRAS
jgi:peptidoglycan hydrolase CwlO-like protein